MKRATFLLLVLAVLAAGCATKPGTTGGANNTTSTSGTSMSPTAVTVTVGDGPTADVPPKLFTLSPATLALKLNTLYNLTLKNTGRGAHDLVIDKLGVKINSTAPSASASVEFTPTQTGTFDMYCTLGMAPADHRSNGMAGKVTVS